MVRILEKNTPVKKTKAVSKEELEKAAYYHWLERGCPANDGLTDWVEAEKSLVKAPKASTK